MSELRPLFFEKLLTDGTLSLDRNEAKMRILSSNLENNFPTLTFASVLTSFKKLSM